MDALDQAVQELQMTAEMRETVAAANKKACVRSSFPAATGVMH